MSTKNSSIDLFKLPSEDMIKKETYDSLFDKDIVIEEYFVPGGGGALPYKPIRDVPFFRVSFFSINS